MAEIIGKNRSKVARAPKSSYSSRDLEAALKLVNSLGFKVTAPTSEEDLAKLEKSKKKLGFSDAVRKVTEVHPKQALRAVLQHTHRIGGEVYGPGEIVLSPDQDTLFRALIHQDALTISNLRDSSEYVTRSRCFMVGQKGFKREVSEVAFNSQELPFEPAFSVGAMDVAGYNPNIQSIDRVF